MGGGSIGLWAYGSGRQVEAGGRDRPQAKQDHLLDFCVRVGGRVWSLGLEEWGDGAKLRRAVWEGATGNLGIRGSHHHNHQQCGRGCLF